MISDQNPNGNGFSEKRAALETAFAHYDAATKSPKASSDLAIAERRVIEACNEVSLELTHPGVYALDLWMQGPARLTALMIAIEIGIFGVDEESTDLDQLSQRLSTVDKGLLRRVMRMLTSVGCFIQDSNGRYHATKFARKLASDPVSRAWLKIATNVTPSANAIPTSLRNNNYVAPTDPNKAGVGIATGGTLFDWLQRDEDMRNAFDIGMRAQDDLPAEEHSHTTFPYGDFLQGSSPNEVAFIDIGGGNGHAMRRIISEHPDITGRFILLELPFTIADVQKSNPPFECVVGDFLQEIPFKGARVYHIMRCLHDWGDETCRVILKNIRAAMKPGFSRLLINEFVMPEIAKPLSRSAMLDIVMMALSGQERDEVEWRDLLESSGLRMVKVWRASIGDMAIIEAVVKE